MQLHRPSLHHLKQHSAANVTLRAAPAASRYPNHIRHFLSFRPEMEQRQAGRGMVMKRCTLSACLVALTLTCAPTWAASPTATFNLVCAGSETRSHATVNENVSFKRIYRIDLAHNRWCTDRCASTNEIVRTTAITLTLEDGANFGGETTTLFKRETGRLVSVSKIGDHVIVDFADCRKAPFGGMPAIKF